MTTIKEARQKLGLTQKEFAPLLGMTQQAVARIESGKSSTLWVLFSKLWTF